MRRGERQRGQSVEEDVQDGNLCMEEDMVYEIYTWIFVTYVTDCNYIYCTDLCAPGRVIH